MRSIEPEKLTDVVKNDSIASNNSAAEANTEKLRPGVLNLLHPVLGHDESELAQVVNPNNIQG